MLENRTAAYLNRQLSSHGKSFIKTFSLGIPHLDGVFFRDLVYEKHYQKENLLFYKFKTTIKGNNHVDYTFCQFLKHIRKTKAYKTDYPLELYKSHIVVFNSDEEFSNAFKNFELAHYSKMYSKEQIKQLKFPEIRDGKVSHVWCTLSKDPRGYEKFKIILSERYKTNACPPLEQVKEFDIPWLPEQEILNYQYSQN